MAAIEIIFGETARLELVLEDGDITLYPKARVYQVGNASPLASINLNHLAEGLYEGSWNPLAIGVYSVVYTVYTDPARTIPSTRYSKELDQLLVRADLEQQIKDMVEQILAGQENSFIDNTVYDDCCQVLSSRLRVFDSKAHCELATDGGAETLGLIATYQIVVDYTGPAKLKTYRKVRL